jgi:phosphonate transport system substrate-binding protein
MTRLRFASYLAPNLRPLYAAVAAFAGRRLGIATELVAGRAPEELVDADVDVGFLCSPPYIRLRALPGDPVEVLAAPVLQGSRFAGTPVYFSDVIVRRDSRFRSFADLRGGSWAYNETDSYSGYWAVRRHLAEMNEEGGFFGLVVEAGFHRRAIRLVAEGRVDAAAIDCQVLELELARQPGLGARLRVIETLGPAPIQPVVAATRLPESLRGELRLMLREIDRDPVAGPVLVRSLVTRFVSAGDADYDPIRAALAAAARAPLATADVEAGAPVEISGPRKRLDLG